MQEVNGRGRGDLFATLQVAIPKKLTQEQRQLVEELARSLPKDQFEPRAAVEDQSEDRNIFERVKNMFG
jgi:DnaJ-class molecular chaperone